MRHLKKIVGERKSPITLNCFISGHIIPLDHWYRKPDEGTRVCGNVGHWLDLAVHILNWGLQVPNQWDIQLAYSDTNARDDDISISMTSSEGDLIVIVLTARNEPFEGINETINFQCNQTICKIDDFRDMTIWQGEKLQRKNFWPKDVGHKNAILQPFKSQQPRNYNEVMMSTLLMLHIAEMVKTGATSSQFSFSKSWDLIR